MRHCLRQQEFHRRSALSSPWKPSGGSAGGVKTCLGTNLMHHRKPSSGASNHGGFVPAAAAVAPRLLCHRDGDVCSVDEHNGSESDDYGDHFEFTDEEPPFATFLPRVNDEQAWQARRGMQEEAQKAAPHLPQIEASISSGGNTPLPLGAFLAGGTPVHELDGGRNDQRQGSSDVDVDVGGWDTSKNGRVNLSCDSSKYKIGSE